MRFFKESSCITHHFFFWLLQSISENGKVFCGILDTMCDFLKFVRLRGGQTLQYLLQYNI